MSQKRVGYSLGEAIRLLRDRVVKERVEIKHPTLIANIKLNLKPFKYPGHRIKGVFNLPHGSGKRVEVAAWSSDPNHAEKALDAGALFSGTDVGDRIADVSIRPILMMRKLPPVQTTYFRRLVATNDLANMVTADSDHKVARMLAKYLMSPCVEDRTVVDPEDFVDCVEKHASGKYMKWQIDKGGQLHCILGRVGETEPEYFAENLHYVMKKLHSLRPENLDPSRELVKTIYLGTSMMGAVPIDIAEHLDYWKIPLVATKKRAPIADSNKASSHESKKVTTTAANTEEETRTYTFLH